MIDKKTWKEFRESGLLWFCNRMLHAFGWAIVFVFDDDDNIIDVYPARVKFRGFSEDCEVKGFKDISKYMKENAEILQKESEL